jgi:ribosomal protein L3
MKNAGTPDFAIEFMMGHKVDSTKAAYYLRNDTELEQIYLKFMPAVIIQPTETQVIQSKEYKELSERLSVYEVALKERNGEIRKLQEDIKKKDEDILILKEMAEEMAKTRRHEPSEFSKEDFEKPPKMLE